MSNALSTLEVDLEYSFLKVFLRKGKYPALCHLVLLLLMSQFAQGIPIPLLLLLICFHFELFQIVPRVVSMQLFQIDVFDITQLGAQPLTYFDIENR